MIHKLVQLLAELLRATVQEAESFSAPDKQIQVGVSAAPTDDDLLPLVALYAGKLVISQKARELSAGQTRPQSGYEQVDIPATDTQIDSHKLKQQPLANSVSCRLILEAGKLTERSLTLLENKDFTVDYGQGKLTFSEPLPAASRLLIQFSFAGIFTLNEFKQDLFIDVFAADLATVEQWTALVMALVLTSQNNLVTQYNAALSEYSAGSFGASSTLSQIWLLESSPTASTAITGTQLHFQVQGQLKLTSALTDGVALIEKIQTTSALFS